MNDKTQSCRHALWFAFGVLLVSGANGLMAQEQPQAQADQDIPDAIVRKVDPSVVAIKHESAIGSGFIISTDGYILSNGHVVRGSDDEDPMEPAQSITVILNDERKFPAKVLGFCMNPDVALLKIECDTPLSPVEFADSRNAQIGQKVFAVGTPQGFKRTFSSGILSNVDRTDLGTFTKVIQTDAAINPGNSGGPLFDRDGKVLGLNTYASQGANNLGFTIPIHVAEEIRKDLMTSGRFIRADVPVFSVSEVYEEMKLALGVERGVLVDYVMENTPADSAGLRAGDVIIRQNGQPMAAATQAELKDVIWALTILEPGTPVEWVVLRKDGNAYKEVKILATIQEAEPMPGTQRFPGELKTQKLDAVGLSFMDIVSTHRIMHGLQDDPGILVHAAEKGSPAEMAELRGGDIVTHVGGLQVTDVASFSQQLESLLSTQEKYIDMTIRRRQISVKTVLAPYYDLMGKRVLVVVPSDEPRYLDLVRRELIAHGAMLTFASVSGTCTEATLKDVKKLSAVASDAVDLLILLDGGNARDDWENETLLELIRGVFNAEGVLAGVGSSVITLVLADPGLLAKKMTTSKDDSSEAIRRKALYTGKAVEQDVGLVTTTGFDRKTVRAFLKEVVRAGSGAGGKRASSMNEPEAAPEAP
ncbi:MAG TPA: hypothetical protein DCS43_08405 [Verrucomicrobia bacterium]|nr:hypothetical protein [Verrucomicrobiota bacterium]